MRARLHSKANVYYLKNRHDRQAWKKEQIQACWWCGRGDCDLEIHEPCRKSQAPGKWAHRSNYALLCHKCHESHFAAMPLPLQLWVKLQRDKKDFSLEEWLKIRNRGPEEVTMKDILEAGRNVSLPVLRPKHSLKF